MDDLKDNRFKPWMKITALFTAFFFCATNLVSADIVQTINSSNHPAPALDLAKISLPESIGEVRKIFNGKNDSFVVHIQDAHASDETQLNISEILNYFYKRFGLRVIGVEGASQELRTDAYSFFPFKDAREAASKYFLKEGRLSGPEYFGVVEQPQAILVGVEDQKLYEENREAYLAALKTKQGDEELIRGILKQLNALARFALSPELRELLEKSYRFDVEPDQFMDYVSYLLAAAKSNQIDQAQYARVAELERISVMGKKIQSESAIRQLDRLLKELPMILSNQESRDFEDRVSGFQRRLISKKEFYGFVIASIKNVTDAKFQTKYADVLSYLEYLIAADGIDLKVMDEINRLEELLKEKLFQGQTDRLVAELFARAEILSNLFDFSLTKEDAQKYFANRNTYSVSEFRQAICPEIKKHRGECSIDARFDLLDEHRKSIDTFYQAAIQRDSVLIEKSIQTMKKRKVGIAALVTGGFHTAGIEKRLEELGYSYVTIVPAIRKKMDLVKGEKLYQESLREDPLRIEKIIRDEKRISTR